MVKICADRHGKRQPCGTSSRASTRARTRSAQPREIWTLPIDAFDMTGSNIQIFHFHFWASAKRSIQEKRRSEGRRQSSARIVSVAGFLAVKCRYDCLILEVHGNTRHYQCLLSLFSNSNCAQWTQQLSRAHLLKCAHQFIVLICANQFTLRNHSSFIFRDAFDRSNANIWRFQRTQKETSFLYGRVHFQCAWYPLSTFRKLNQCSFWVLNDFPCFLLPDFVQ